MATSIRALLTGVMAVSVSMLALAADPLAGTSWKTIDEKTGQPKGIITFSERGGVLTGVMTKRLSQNVAGDRCTSCPGKLKNQPYIGLPIVTGLRAKGSGEYGDGKVLDPASGKIYKLNAKMAADGKALEVRGYVGMSLLGRSQTWVREQ